ncbi:hypothetical protein MMG85_17310 [Pseudoxanthomonas sp. LH2527]|uniref:hypothetical protein n=1 Tax=Pseudoxanthomonas sp. LH2527 TaxID=2923249 RepID=UPI001F146B79|nr:hypothetical protein [Pseudoxanthomonas sp. LH2527]MCH6485313.1 hypothetical protein [Pseudoxanthomonas sp. LH2527]
MSRIAAGEFAEMSAPLLRFTEAKYLFEQFKSARNAEVNYGLFLLTAYFDSLLFCLVSVEEMVDESARKNLRSIKSFLFLKALRNITTHHSVLSGVKGKFPRPVSRIVSVGVGCRPEFSEQFVLIPERLREIFDKILAERRGEKHTLQGAREYLDQLEASGTRIMLVDTVQSAIAEIEPHVA